MKTQNVNLATLLDLTQFEQMKVYMGNGKNAVRGTVKKLQAKTKGITVKAECNVVVYSYRWHKLVWTYYINGEIVNRAAVKRLTK